MSTAPKTTLALDVHLSAPATFGVTSTLISGPSEAVLIDGQFALSEGRRLADRIRRTQKTLTIIYVTHSHPDHYFGLGPVLEAYPEARVVAIPENVERIRESAPGKVEQWTPVFGEEVTESPVIPEPLEGDTIELEGEELRIALVGQGDDVGNTAVHVPALEALISGDFVYNGTHVWLADSTPDQWRQWLDNLDELAALNARTLVAGHKAASRPDDPGLALSATREYIRDFSAFVSESSSAPELIEKVKDKYGDRELEVILELSAGAVFQKEDA